VVINYEPNPANAVTPWAQLVAEAEVDLADWESKFDARVAAVRKIIEESADDAEVEEG
jgi:hypothetical protein